MNEILLIFTMLFWGFTLGWVLHMEFVRLERKRKRKEAKKKKAVARNER